MTLTVIFILFIVSTFFVLYKKIKSGLSLLIATCILSYSIGCGALPSFLLLKVQIPYAQNPNIVWQKSNAIVMLGAGTYKIPNTDSVIPSFMSYSRLLKTASLYLDCKKTHQQCKVVLSGGDAFKTGVPEAIQYSETLSKLGVNQNDMLLEKNSLNTYQNAEFSSQILKEKQFNQIFLVTSGIHLKRALLYFSHFDIYPEPIIADYINPHFTIIPIAYNFAMTDFVLHEYIGIWRFYIYNFLGWNTKQKIQNPALSAIVNEQPDIVLNYLNHGIDANISDSKGNTAMIFAATTGNTEIIKMLYLHGAKINRANQDGITPLMAAAGAGETHAVSLLLSYGADPCLKDKQNQNALQTAYTWWGVQETQQLIQSHPELQNIICKSELP